MSFRVLGLAVLASSARSAAIPAQSSLWSDNFGSNAFLPMEDLAVAPGTAPEFTLAQMDGGGSERHLDEDAPAPASPDHVSPPAFIADPSSGVITMDTVDPAVPAVPAVPGLSAPLSDTVVGDALFGDIGAPPLPVPPAQPADS